MPDLQHLTGLIFDDRAGYEHYIGCPHETLTKTASKPYHSAAVQLEKGTNRAVNVTYGKDAATVRKNSKKWMTETHYVTLVDFTV